MCELLNTHGHRRALVASPLLYGPSRLHVHSDRRPINRLLLRPVEAVVSPSQIPRERDGTQWDSRPEARGPDGTIYVRIRAK